MTILTKSFTHRLSDFGIEQGSYFDNDYLLRARGLSCNMSIAELIVCIEVDGVPYKLEINFCSAGEQKFYDENPNLSPIVASANKEKLPASDSKQFLDELNNGIVVDSGSWIEGILSLENLKSNEILIDYQYESSLGLEGVWSSVQDIFDAHTEEYISSTIKYLLSNL